MNTVNLRELVPAGANPRDIYFYYNRRGAVDWIRLPSGPAGRAAFGGAFNEIASIGVISPDDAANEVPASMTDASAYMLCECVGGKYRPCLCYVGNTEKSDAMHSV